jgi:hypothetical protein
MAIADPGIHICYSLRRRWLGGGANFNKKRCYMMNTDTLVSKLERIHVLADILLELLIGNPQAQVLTELIMETSQLR